MSVLFRELGMECGHGLAQRGLPNNMTRAQRFRVQLKPESWNSSPFSDPNTKERRKTGVNHPKSAFKLFGIYWDGSRLFGNAGSTPPGASQATLPDDPHAPGPPTLGHYLDPKSI